jgi:hypothetical protein
VLVHGEVAAGAAVHAYRTFADVLANAPAASSGPVGGDGSFRLDLPPGRYFLLAKQRAAGPADGPLAVGDAFAYHGASPLAVEAGRHLHVGFGLQRKAAEVAYRAGEDAGTGSIEGVVEHDGAPLDGASVRIFLDDAELFRGRGYATAAPTGPDGGFRLDLLPESEFFLVARKRALPGEGPVAEGDYFGYFADNPVRVRAGQVAAVRLGAMLRESAAPAAAGGSRAAGTRLAGRILDPAGRVVPGVYAFAYEEKVMGHKRPAAMSRPVDAEGRYVLALPGGGVYYVGARSAYGDSPGIGEWYGRYDVTADHAVQAVQGELLDGVDIVVEKILP